MRSPSWNISTASAGIEPGAMPPTSAWWARLAAQPTSRSRPTKHGATRVMSLRCVPPANGSLRMHLVAGAQRVHRRRRWRPPPTRASSRGARGCARPGRAARRRAVNSAAEQSARSLMLGLNAAPPQHGAHLLGHAGRGARSGPGATAGSTRAPSPTSARHPAGTQTVQSGSAITAGPVVAPRVTAAGPSWLTSSAGGRRARRRAAPRPRRVRPGARIRCAGDAPSWKSSSPVTVSSWLCPAYRQSSAVAGTVASPPPTAATARAASSTSAASRPSRRAGVRPRAHQVALRGASTEPDGGQHAGARRHDDGRACRAPRRCAHACKRPRAAERDEGEAARDRRPARRTPAAAACSIAASTTAMTPSAVDTGIASSARAPRRGRAGRGRGTARRQGCDRARGRRR